MDFGWPNVKIGQKMANGQLLFLALMYSSKHSDNFKHKFVQKGFMVKISITALIKDTR